MFGDRATCSVATSDAIFLCRAAVECVRMGAERDESGASKLTNHCLRFFEIAIKSERDFS